jgi:hypothetical protein
MRFGKWVACAAAGITLVAGTSGGVEAQQDLTIKGGVAVSRLTGSEYWDQRTVATTFGGHVRFHFGPIALQPELHVTTKGATASSADEDERLRLEYIEVPALLVLPVRVGEMEAFAYGGPSIILESRCRYIIRRDGLRTNFPCDPPAPPVFRRPAFDFGAVAGGGIAHRLFNGRASLEARHTWGLRNINSTDSGASVKNRTISVMLGYSMSWAPADGQ